MNRKPLILITLALAVAPFLVWGCAATETPAAQAEAVTETATLEPEPSPEPSATSTPLPSPTPEPTATPLPTRPAGETRIDEFGIEQVWVPAGTFRRGTANIDDLIIPPWAKKSVQSEQPQHEVTLTKGYWIDKYEVTTAAFQAFIDAGGYTTEEYWSEGGREWLSWQTNIDNLRLFCGAEDGPEFPQVCVTWFEAEAYANWRGGRLPTEAEWEYAARGPESHIYPWGDTFDPDKANVVDSEDLTPVGSYPDGVSWVGAHDMAGNAMEWAQDWLDFEYYQLQESVDPQGPESGRIKVEKGGWWGSNPTVARSAYHHFEDPPTYQDHHIGFRIVTAETDKE